MAAGVDLIGLRILAREFRGLATQFGPYFGGQHCRLHGSGARTSELKLPTLSTISSVEFAADRSYAGPSGACVIRRFVAAVALAAAFGAGGAPLGARAGRQAPGPASTSTQSRATETALVIGRVVDATTGAPIDDAIVTLLSTPPASGGAATRANAGPKRKRVLVNGHGQFVFGELSAGSMLISVSAPGYMPGGAGARVPGGEPALITLGDGQHLADVTIRLWRFASIEGAIFDEVGDPVAGVPVHLLERTVGERRLVGGPIAMTDDRGVFRFAALDPGRYLVLVQSTTTSMPASAAAEYFSQLNENVSPLVRGPVTGAPEPSAGGFRIGDSVLQPSTALGRDAPAPSPTSGVQIYRTTFYPNAPVASQAAGVDLVAGDDRTGIDLTLPLVRTVSLSGVVGGPGGPMSSVTLRLVPADVTNWPSDEGFEAAWTTTDAQGAFTFLGVPPAQYLIEGSFRSTVASPLELPGANTDELWVRTPVSVGDAPITRLSLTAHANLQVTGRVQFDGTSQVPPSVAGIALATLDRDAQTPQLAVVQNGRFSIDGCLAGRYAIEAPSVALAGAFWTVASIMAGGRDLLTQPLDLETNVTDVVITYTDRPTSLAGAVRPADPQDGPLAVIAFPADYEAAADAGMLGRRIATVDVEGGRYSINGLPPGNYLVAAIPTNELSVWMQPGPIRQVASQASTVSLTIGSRVTVDLRSVVIR